jgi:site-specific recombinase XerD
MNHIIKLTESQEMLSDLIEIWFDYIELRFSPMTVIMYKLALKQFLSTLPAKTPKDSITPLHIEKYINYLVKTNHTNRTANCYLIAIRSFFRWAVNYYQIDNPAACIPKLIERPPKYRCLSQGEYQKIIDVTQGVENAALQFLGNTGLRRNEFRSLTYANFTTNFIQIIKGKGHKKRLVPLNNVCKELLQKYSQNGNLVPPFVDKFQHRESLYYLCQKLARQVSIPSFGPHALRHFFATRLIRAGISLIKVSKILGHSSITITEKIYVHLIPEDLLGVTDCLEF